MNNESRNIPITELDLPMIRDQIIDGPVGAEVLVDGHPARCYLSSPAWRSEGIIIEFDPPHPKFGEQFGTGYYRFLAPGLLGWGHDGEVMEVVLAIDDAHRAH